MARFRGTLSGQRGVASRLGSKKSGLTADVNGWRGGVRVVAEVDDGGRDVFEVYATAGSSAYSEPRYLGYVVVGQNGPAWMPWGKAGAVLWEKKEADGA